MLVLQQKIILYGTLKGFKQEVSEIKLFVSYNTSSYVALKTYFNRKSLS